MYNQRSAKIRQKEPISVAVELVNGVSFEAIVYIALGHRLADLLNDERAFIPVERDGGDFLMIAKSQIASIGELFVADEEATSADQLDDENTGGAAKGRKFDPYAHLKLDPAATLEEVRAAYKSRIKLVHPDSVASLGLHDDLADAALRATQKLNYAYQKILRERNRAHPQGEETRASA